MGREAVDMALPMGWMGWILVGRAGEKEEGGGGGMKAS